MVQLQCRPMLYSVTGEAGVGLVGARSVDYDVFMTGVIKVRRFVQCGRRATGDRRMQ